MGLIKPYMAVKCRTADEVAIYEEVARAEGHSTPYGEIGTSRARQRVYVTNYSPHFVSPRDVGYTTDVDYVDADPGQIKIVVEASDLFRNLLISRRIKNGNSEKRHVD